MRYVTHALITLALLAPSTPVAAEPLMTMIDGAPSPAVVIAWTGDGKKIELTLREDADPQAVAAAIESGVDGVRVKVRAGKLVAIGLKKAPLLEALTEVELGGDDLDVLAEAASTEDDYDTGSSLRAKKTASLSKLLKDRKTTAVGRVVSVKSGKFPDTKVVVQILRGPTGKLGKTIRKGKRIAFYPVVRRNKGGIDLKEARTRANLGAWYLKKGDRVRVRIGTRTPKGYRADLIVR